MGGTGAEQALSTGASSAAQPPANSARLGTEGQGIEFICNGLDPMGCANVKKNYRRLRDLEDELSGPTILQTLAPGRETRPPDFRHTKLWRSKLCLNRRTLGRCCRHPYRARDGA
jgi:hypothetical protein